MKKSLYTILLFCCLVIPAQATTYNAYFSNAATGNATGTDTPVALTDCNGSDAANTCSTLAHAQEYIELAGSADTVNLYFDKGDTWTADTWCSGSTPCLTVTWMLTIDSSDPIVNVDAYGSGAKPKFYGNVSDFTVVPPPNSGTYPNNPYRHSRLFDIEKDGCSVKNVWFDGIYASAIFIGDGIDSITVDSCDFTNLGKSAVKASGSGLAPTSGTTVTKCLIHTTEELYRNIEPGTGYYGGAIHLAPIPASGSVAPSNNNVSYNVLYNNAGEGIHCQGCTIEYNIVGDTGSVAILSAPWDGDCGNTIIRYNLVTFSDYSSSVYDNIGVVSQDGIVFGDERSAGNNTNATVDVYGNIVINRLTGINFRHNSLSTSPYASIKIFNNTVIDSSNTNYVIATYSWNMVAAGQGYIENNLSILYDQTDSIHAADWNDPAGLSTYWTIANNLFWTTGGSPTVDTDWDNTCGSVGGGDCIGNPLLAGEEQGSPVDWNGQPPGDPRNKIDFSDLKPQAGSAAIDVGVNLLTWATQFLGEGTDFDDLPDTQSFILKTQIEDYWDIGAYLLGFSIYGQYPTALQACDNGSSTDTAGVTSSANGNCKYSDISLGDDCDTTFANLDNSFTGGEGGTAHTFNSTVNCNSQKVYAVKCQDVSTLDISDCLEIIHSVAAGGGGTPQPPPAGECYNIIGPVRVYIQGGILEKYGN